jgi:hypothetical protein
MKKRLLILAAATALVVAPLPADALAAGTVAPTALGAALHRAVSDGHSGVVAYARRTGREYGLAAGVADAGYE